MMLEQLGLAEVASGIITIAAVWAALTVLLSPLRKLARVVDKKLDTLDSLTRDVASLSGRLDTIVHETTPNRGSSMKDALARIEDRQCGTHRTLERIETRLDTHLETHAKGQG